MFNDVTINSYFYDVSQLGFGESNADWYACINWTTGKSCLIAGSLITSQAF